MKLSTTLLPLSAGALLGFAFAPYSTSFLVWPALFALLLSCQQQRGLLPGWLFGFSYFGIGLYWVTHSIHLYGNLALWLACLCMGLFVALLALFPALQTWLMTRCTTSHAIIKSFEFALVWTLSESARSVLFTGFPWLLLGTSQVNSIFSAWAPFIGTYGISFALCFTCGCIFYGLYLKKNRLACLITISILALSVGLAHWLLQAHSFIHPQGKLLPISLIQGDIAQSTKWSPVHSLHVLQRYQQLSHDHWQHRLVVWPETAIPIDRDHIQPQLKQIANQARTSDSTLIAGIPIFNNTQKAYTNSLLAMGTISGRYDKVHLVPFGEYTPFAQLLKPLIQHLNIPMSDLIAGARLQPLFEFGNSVIAPFICYEIAFSSQVFATVPKANVLLVASDDSWFGHSAASAQHLQIARMRALETGRPILFVSNGGVSAIIAPNAHLIQRSPYFSASVLEGNVQPVTGLTPLIRIGQMRLLLLLLLGYLIILIARYSTTIIKTQRRYFEE